MIRRVTSLLLAIVLMLLMLPTPVRGETATVQELRQQIRDTYRKALRGSGLASFNGWCGSLVNWQTYLLGIDTYRYGCDGKNEFDLYRDLGTTTGGYRVKAYPASRYTLREALNTITNDGKLDVYNVLAGFQKTNTREGSIYGHAVFIHGIVDGVVYYMECFPTSVGGTYWEEGAAISCSIDTFCRYYDSWTVFDGVAYFGIKTYADLCTSYPASMYAMTAAGVSVKTEPVDPGVNDNRDNTLATFGKGRIFQVTELLETPGGELWYRVRWNGQDGFLPAQALIPMESVYSDLALDSLKAPTVIRKGYGFVLGGTVSAQYNQLRQIQVRVYSLEGKKETDHCLAQVDYLGKQFSLNTGRIDSKLSFRKLPVGTYRLSISARVYNCVVIGGTVEKREDTVTLWDCQFRVAGDWNRYDTVTFDAAGGTTPLDSITVPRGETLTQLPEPSRPGFTFAGWYTKAQDGQRFGTDTPVSGSITVYARWIKSDSQYTGWMESESGWDYMEEGSSCTGWFTSNGVLFYRDPEGKIPKGWTELDSEWYYFSDQGAALTGWLEYRGNRYYLRQDGSRAEGWAKIGNERYWFDSQGVMLTGWLKLSTGTYYLAEDGSCTVGDVTVDGRQYHFLEDGLLQTGWVTRENKQMYLDEEGIPVTGWYSVEGAACYFGTDGSLYLMTNKTDDYGCLLSWPSNP